jgi:N-formylglutamate deformylase
MWEIVEGDGPVIATAIHDGHEVRDEVATRFALSEADRHREQDPHTGVWAEVAATRIVARRSRFEVDLNRPREKAVYVSPQDAWGLDLWREPLTEDLVSRSLAQYDAFYADLERLLASRIERFGVVVVLDLHTYNHRREGPEGPHADATENPEVNVGTGTLDREFWSGLVDRFIGDLRAFDFGGRSLDVRENVKFRGGHMSRWIHETFPERACSLAIEFKKFFMDEWTGELDEVVHAQAASALRSTLPGLHSELERVRSRMR